MKVLQQKNTHINFNKQVYVALSFLFALFSGILRQVCMAGSWEKVSTKALSLWSMAQFTWLYTIKYQSLMLNTTVFTVWEATLAWLWLISKHLTCHCHIIHCTFFNFLMLLKPKDWIGCAVQCCCIEKKHRKYKQCLYLCRLLEM